MSPPSYTSANVTVMVHDLDRAVRFYTETLGLRLRERFGPHWASVEAPGLFIGLHPGGSPTTRIGRGSLSIGLEVADLAKAVKELQRKGVRSKPGDPKGANRLAYFSDPDGNPLYLIESRASTGSAPPGSEPPGSWSDEGGR